MHRPKQHQIIKSVKCSGAPTPSDKFTNTALNRPGSELPPEVGRLLQGTACKAFRFMSAESRVQTTFHTHRGILSPLIRWSIRKIVHPSRSNALFEGFARNRCLIFLRACRHSDENFCTSLAVRAVQKKDSTHGNLQQPN